MSESESSIVESEPSLTESEKLPDSDHESSDSVVARADRVTVIDLRPPNARVYFLRTKNYSLSWCWCRVDLRERGLHPHAIARLPEALLFQKLGAARNVARRLTSLAPRHDARRPARRVPTRMKGVPCLLGQVGAVLGHGCVQAGLDAALQGWQRCASCQQRHRLEDSARELLAAFDARPGVWVQLPRGVLIHRAGPHAKAIPCLSRAAL